VIEIFQEDGSVRKYRSLSERLPEFLAAFPISEGFRVEVEAKALAEICPGVESAGVVFTASLYKGDAVVANASAHRFSLSQFKDWEKGETAARQRLLAACGFGGDVLDEDEALDMKDQGLQVAQVPPSPPTQKAAEKQPEPSVSPTKEKPPVAAKERPVAAKESPAPPQPPREDVPVALMRQIEHQAKLRGVPCPSPSNLDEARQALKALLRK